MQKRVCIAQIDIDSNNPKENISKMRRIIQEHREADLIIFPELVIHGHIYSSAPRQEILEMISKTPTTMKDDLYAFAQECDTRVIFGEFDRIGDKIYNIGVYISRDKVERYAKTHVHWSENFDASFPEAARVLALQGAKVIVTIAAVPKDFDVKYMHRRMTSIALNNQVFSIFANRTGRNFCGHSAIFNPRGDCIAEAGEKEEVLLAEIDLHAVDAWRIQESIYPNRRPELYSQIARPNHGHESG